MAIQIGLIVIIIFLLIYIVFLHNQLTKKNIFIESTIKRLSGIEKSRSIDEMMTFLEELQKLSIYSKYFADKILEENSMKFILGNEKDVVTFMHYTKEEEVAKRILNDGFKFVDSFYKTAIPVSSDKLDIIIKHNSRKYYGEFLIIICISNDIVNFYSLELEKAGIKNYSYENILTDLPRKKIDNSDFEYQLSHQFIKGYINHKTGEIVKNRTFDPLYNSPAFIKNVELLKTNPFSHL